MSFIKLHTLHKVECDDTNVRFPFVILALFGNAHLLDELNENFDEYASISLLYKRIFKDYRTVGKKIKEFYFQNKKMDNTTKQQVIDVSASICVDKILVWTLLGFVYIKSV